MNNNEYMKVAVEEANINMKENFVNGGPFGAVIVKDGKIISRAHNTVLKSKDATAHAEVNAIREASKVLNTHDLSGCILYTKEEANEIGFRDDIIYEYIKGNNKDLINLHKLDEETAKEAFDSFKNSLDKEIY